MLPLLLALAADTISLPPHTDLAGANAPDTSRRSFTIRVAISRLGQSGVLAAQDGPANGWSLFVRNGELHFVMNRADQSHAVAAKLPAAKTLGASVAADGAVTLLADGQPVGRAKLPGLLPAKPIDGLQIGRDQIPVVGDYVGPFAFDGVIESATLELGDAVPLPPFVGSVPSGGPVPRMDVAEQQKHPGAQRDRFGGHTGVQLKASGFFRVEKVKGRWIFVTPEGHPFIAIGPNHTGPTIRNQGRTNGLWARFDNSPDAAAKGLLPIIHNMGFTAGDVYQPESTYTKTLPWITFFWYGNANQTFVDVFNAPALQDVERRAYEHAKSVADNPWVLGIAGPDLSIWDNKLVRAYRKLSPQAPGRRRYQAFLRQRYQSDIAKFNRVYGTAFSSFDDLAAQEQLVYPLDLDDDKLEPFTLRWRLPVTPGQSANPALQADNDAFCVLVAETLFPAVKAAVRRGAPNHLFMGEHLALRMIPDAVVRVMGKHVDVYLAQAVEVSPQRPPEWQVFQKDRWDAENKLLGDKPIVIVDWGAVFSLAEPFAHRGATIKQEKEASDDSARFVADAFSTPYIVGLFVCKLLGDHRNDETIFQKRATRTYLKPDGSPYPYRSQAIRDAFFAAQDAVFQRVTAR